MQNMNIWIFAPPPQLSTFRRPCWEPPFIDPGDIHTYTVHVHTYIIQLTPWRGFLETDYIKYYAYLYLLHRVNFPRRRKPERSEKTHDLRQSVDWLFSHAPGKRESNPRSQTWKALCSDDCANEAPCLSAWLKS